jgi:hypothetical protein
MPGILTTTYTYLPPPHIYIHTRSSDVNVIISRIFYLFTSFYVLNDEEFDYLVVKRHQLCTSLFIAMAIYIYNFIILS